MFQSFNQFLVLGAILFTGIGGFAAPARRQDTTFSLVNIDANQNSLCVDVADNNVETPATFQPCVGGDPQTFEVQDSLVTPGAINIVHTAGESCLGINPRFKIVLQNCATKLNPDLASGQEWSFDKGVVSNSDFHFCMTRDGLGNDVAGVCNAALADPNQAITKQTISLVQN